MYFNGSIFDSNTECIYFIGNQYNNTYYKYSIKNGKYTILPNIPLKKDKIVDQHSVVLFKYKNEFEINSKYQSFIISMGGYKSSHLLIFDINNNKWINAELNKYWINNKQIIHHSSGVSIVTEPNLKGNEYCWITGGAYTTKNVYLLNIKSLMNALIINKTIPNLSNFCIKKEEYKLPIAMYKHKSCFIRYKLENESKLTNLMAKMTNLDLNIPMDITNIIALFSGKNTLFLISLKTKNVFVLVFDVNVISFFCQVFLSYPYLLPVVFIQIKVMF